MLPRLIVLTSVEHAPTSIWCKRVDAIGGAARPGSVVVVLRDKERSCADRLRFGRELSEICRAHQQRFGVADRVDLGLALDADWLHLGEVSLRSDDARALAPHVTLSRAWHDPELPPDDAVLLLSPIASARKGRAPLGLAALRRAVTLAGTRNVYALGGIDANVAASCLAIGVRGVAVVGAALDPGGSDRLLRVLDILA